MAGSTHGLCMSLCSVQVFLFSSVTYSAVVCGGGPTPCYSLQSVQCGHDYPTCGEGGTGVSS